MAQNGYIQQFADQNKVNTPSGTERQLFVTDNPLIGNPSRALYLKDDQGTIYEVAGGGAQGSQGTQGFQGSQGFQGVAGSGAQGSQGFQGNQGSQGSQGFQGVAGSGVQGSQGSQGFQGTQGFQGLTGSQGAQGFQGTTGSQGTQGFQGTAGSQGFQGFQGVSASSFLQQNVFVDSVNGNDATAIKYRPDKPYLTLTAAVAAAISGDTLWTFPGTYAPTTQIAKNGVNYYFEVGVIINDSALASTGLFNDSGVAGGNLPINIKVDGLAQFNFTVAGKRLINLTNSNAAATGSVVSIKCKGISHGSSSAYIVEINDNYANIIVECLEDIIATTGSIVNAFPNAVAANTNVTLKANTINTSSTDNSFLARSGGQITTINIYANKFIVSTPSPQRIIVINTSNTFINFYSKIEKTGTAQLIESSANSVVNLYGDILETSNAVFLIDSAAGPFSGIINVYGTVTAGGTTNQIINFTQAATNGKVVLYNDAIAGTSGGAGTLPAISLGAAVNDAVQIEVSRLLKNFNTGAGADGIFIGKTTVLNTRVLQMARIVVQGTNDSVDGAVGSTVQSYPGSSANRAVNANVTTQSVAAITIDADVS